MLPSSPHPSHHFLAPAKINLFLHVVEKRENGTHGLESLVAFAALGDRIQITPCVENRITLTCSGPMAAGLPEDPEANLVMKLARALQSMAQGKGQATTGVAIHLEKHLPTAAGLGGGSSDAATVLKALSSLWNCGYTGAALSTLSLTYGADIPICLYGMPAIMRGNGEQITPVTHFPAMPILLVNPMIPLLTAQVFQTLTPPYATARANFPTAYPTREQLYDCLRETENSLARPAVLCLPLIQQILDAIAQTKDCRLARLAGSGPTCFGLYDTPQAANEAATQLAALHPDWWVKKSNLFRH